MTAPLANRRVVLIAIETRVHRCGVHARFMIHTRREIYAS
jgi:hypothetical protein